MNEEKNPNELRDIKCKSLAHVTHSLENVNLPNQPLLVCFFPSLSLHFQFLNGTFSLTHSQQCNRNATTYRFQSAVLRRANLEFFFFFIFQLNDTFI